MKILRIERVDEISKMSISALIDVKSGEVATRNSRRVFLDKDLRNLFINTWLILMELSRISRGGR